MLISLSGHKSGDKYLPAGGRRWPSSEEKRPWNVYETISLKKGYRSELHGLNQPKMCVFLNRFVPLYRDSAVTLPNLHTKHNLQLAALSVCSEEMNISSWQTQPGRKQQQSCSNEHGSGLFCPPSPSSLLSACTAGEAARKGARQRLTWDTALFLAHLAM